MEKPLDIAHGGGWFVRQVVARPKARLFFVLSLAWLAASLPASFPFLDGWPKTLSQIEVVAILLIAPHPVFILLALYFWRTEPPRIIRKHMPNPDHDLKKLY